MTIGSSSVSKSQSAKGSSSNSEMLLRLAVPCQMESKVLCATPPGLKQWIESSSEPSVLLVMPQTLKDLTITSVEMVLQAFLTTSSPKWYLANLKAKTLTVQYLTLYQK